MLSISLNDRIKQLAEEFLKLPSEKEIQVLSHFDTDGITSASILVRTLKRLDKKFSVRIVKNLTPEIISEIPKNKIVLFSDLASNSLEHLLNFKEGVFIIDHHEISDPDNIPSNIFMANPQMHDNKEEISSSGLCYLFAKSINPTNKDLASLAVVGMIGDSITNLDVSNNEITKDAEVVIRKGIPLYPSTRPLNRVLEFSSEPYIPGVTGNREGVNQILREIGLNDGKYKSLIELDENEMKKMVTAILLRRMEKNNENLIGNIFLVKHFNQLEDAREMSARINASSRLGEPYTTILYCLGDPSSKKQIERLYAKYRQMILAGLKAVEKVENIEKINGQGYVIINARSEITDTIISVVTTILSKSSMYEQGTIIIAMTYTDTGEVKVSARTVQSGRSVRDLLGKVAEDIGGEFGGHKYAAGCTFPISKEDEFLQKIQKNLEVELVEA